MPISSTHRPALYFFYRAFRFVLILVFLDLAGGWIIKRLYSSQTTGKFSRITHSITKTEADIVLVGTSHTVRHYVPQVFKDSLNKTVYNLGARGQNLYYCVAIVDQLLDRHSPETMIWNIDPELFYGAGNYDKLSDFRPYYWQHKPLRKYVDMQGPWERVKLLSHFYTYNSTLIHLLKYKFAPQKDFDGYLPLKKVTQMKVSKADQQLYGPELEIAEQQIELLEGVLKKAKDKGIEVVFVVSPILAGDRIHSSELEELAGRYQIPFWNYSLDERFILKNELFGDKSHLNHTGALRFSSELSQRLLAMD